MAVDFIQLKGHIEGALTSAVYMSDGYAKRYFASGGAADTLAMNKLLDSLKTSLRLSSIRLDGAKRMLSMTAEGKVCTVEIKLNDVHKKVHCFPAYMCREHIAQVEDINAERKLGNLSESRANMLLRSVFDTMSTCRECFSAETLQ